MNIVIVGAGDVGLYISLILSKNEHNVILIDKDVKKLQMASFSMDIATKEGSGTDWQLLDDLLESSPDLFISLTNDDETNLVACSIAKNLGYGRTIARVKDDRFINRTRLDFSRIFDVDYFICPELLVANDILKNIMSPGALAVETFAHGAVQLRTIQVPDHWRKGHIPLKTLDIPQGVMVGLISRSKREWQHNGSSSSVIFPHGEDKLQKGDEVTFIGDHSSIDEIYRFLGIEKKTVRSVMIIGGSLTGINLARLLVQKKIDVKIVDKDFNVCVELAKLFPECMILQKDAADLAFLKEEKVDLADAVVTCTRKDEFNIMCGMLAKEAGCKDVIVLLSKSSYISLAASFGLHHTLSPRVSAANHILSQILTGRVNSLISVHENAAEVMEVFVSPHSKVVGIPLSELGPLLPKDFLIAMIQNRGRISIANGSRVISPSDTVICITNPKHVADLEKIF